MSDIPQMEYAPAVEEVEQGFDVFDILIVFARYWKLLVGLMILGALIGGGIALRLHPRYEAHSTFLLDQPQPTTASIGIAFLATQGDQTLALLGSNTLADLTLKHLNLLQFNQGLPKDLQAPTTPRAQRNFVMNKTTSMKAPTGIYIISVRDQVPTRAAAIANAYLQGLEDMHDRMNVETAQRSKEFFRQQMTAEAETLQRAEDKLKAAQERTGLLQPEAQTSMKLGEIEGVQNSLRSLQIQRGVALQTMTPDSPEVRNLDQQIAENQKQLAAMESKIHIPSQTNIPAMNIEIAKLEGEVAGSKATMDSFSSQYEHARLQEAYTLPEVRVVDPAEIPVERTWPNPLQIVEFSALAGLVLAVFVMAMVEFWHWLEKQPESMEKVAVMRRNLRLRSS